MPLTHSPSAKGQAYSILLDADDRPVRMIGRISVKTTKGRPTPPAPKSGFVTDYTPFDRGHIMALELNGPDISENIVPQYRMWQQSGAWRKNEEAMAEEKQAEGAVFAAELSYSGHPDTYTAQQANFSKNQIFDWTDKRIPDSFTLWFIEPGDALAQDIEKVLLSNKLATALDLANCFAKLAKVAAYKPFDHKKMPQEDVALWKGVQVGVAFETVYEKYQQQRSEDVKAMELDLQKNPPMDKTAKPAKKLLDLKREREVVDVTRSPLRDPVEFAMTQGEPIKQELSSSFGWPPHETTALNSGKVVQTVCGKQTQNQIKAQSQRHTQYEADYGKSKKAKDDLAAKGVDFKDVGYTGTKKY